MRIYLVRIPRRKGATPSKASCGFWLGGFALGDRIVLDNTAANTGQLFNFSSNNNNGMLYLREDFFNQVIQCSTDNSSWSNLQSIAGTRTITIDPTAVKALVGHTVPGD
jgi:hypothetical protein